MAPEIVKFLGYDHMVDLWAIGVLLYYMASNKEFPFQYKNNLAKTNYQKLIIKQAVLDNFSAEYIDLFT